MTRVRIGIVDDHPTLLRGIASLFAEEGDRYHVVATGASAADIEAIVRDHAPDVLIVDLSMPGDVFEQMRQALVQAPALRIVVFTAFANVDLGARAMASGAIGFVLKGSPPEELFGAVAAAEQGRSFVSPAFAPGLLARLRDNERDSVLWKLSAREAQILDYLMAGRTNKEIARSLSLSDKTVKNYMTSLLAKLNARTRLEAVLIAQELRREHSPPDLALPG